MIPDDMVEGMSLGREPMGCVTPYPYEPPWKPTPTPLWPTDFKFEEKIKHPFNPSREVLGTVVKIKGNIYAKVYNDNWAVQGSSAFYSDAFIKVLYDRLENSDEFQWVNYIQKTQEQVLTELLEHGSVETALDELTYCD